MGTPASTVVQQANMDQARHHELQDQQRQMQNGIDLGVINNPDADPQAKADAYNRMNSRYPVGSHIQFFQDLFHPLQRAHQHAQNAQAQSSANVATNTPSASPDSTPAPVTNPAQMLQGAPGVSATPAQPATPPPAPLAQVQAVGRAQTPDQALSIMKGYASPAEAQNALAQKLSEAITKRDIDLANVKGGYQVEAAKARGGNVRPVANNPGAIALDDARKLRDSGQVFTDRDGEPLDLDTLKDSGTPLKLVPILSPKGNYWMVANQKDRLQVVGNQLVTLPETGTTTPSQMSSLGEKNLGATATHQVPGTLPGEKISLTSTRTPAVGNVQPAATPAQGLQTRPTSAPTAAASPTSAAVTPAARTSPASAGTTAAAPPKMAPAPLSPPALPPAPSAKAIVDKANQKRPQSKQIPQPAGETMPPAFAPGTLLQQARPAMPVVSAMSVVASNIFGAHGDKPLWENAWMYDKPDLRQALNNALTLNALHIPGTEENPGLLETLKTAVGATQWTQEQINQAAVRARQEVERIGGPEALKQFSRAAAMQEDLSALRAATKASAAQGSLNLAVRAAPVYNISSAQDFRNQLGTMLSTAVSSMHGYPGINPAYVNWWDKGVSAAKNGSSSSPSNVEQFLRNIPKKGGGGV